MKRLAAADASYSTWTVNGLGAALAPFGVIQRKTIDGTMHVDRSEIRRALEERDGAEES